MPGRFCPTSCGSARSASGTGTAPALNQGGIAESLAVLKGNYEVLKGQLGFNNPHREVKRFSVRTELARISRDNHVAWRDKLKEWQVPDLWNHKDKDMSIGYVYRRFCRPFAPESAGPQPALLIPFSSTIASGKNWFGNPLAGGDSAFNASAFSAKICSVGVKFDGYNDNALAQTPQVYLVPVGSDRMFLPGSSALEDRIWNVVDQRIPVPLPISSSNLANPDWRPYSGSAAGFFEEIRKFSSFGAYHHASVEGPDNPMLLDGRLVGRSVWNTQWVLIIPSAPLLNDPASPSAGIDTLIFGVPNADFTQKSAGTTNRDLNGISDILLFLDTYSVSGN